MRQRRGWRLKKWGSVMAEPTDFYADGFQVTTTAYGCALNLVRSGSAPPRPGTMQASELMATARMSLEHMKLMAFVLHRQIHEHEVEHSVAVQVPSAVLNSLQIGPEDWEKFWRG